MSYTRQEKTPHDVHAGTVGGAGGGLREESLPGHLLQGGAGEEYETERGQDTGELNAATTITTTTTGFWVLRSSWSLVDLHFDEVTRCASMMLHLFTLANVLVRIRYKNKRLFLFFSCNCNNEPCTSLNV